MAERTIAEIMAEGQKLTLEQAELLRKQIGGTITAEETARLATLTGYLLGLMGEAQARGVGNAVGQVYNPTPEEQYEEFDLALQDAELDEVQDEGPTPRFW